MERILNIGHIDLLNGTALVVTLAFWLLAGWFIEHPPKSRPSVSLLMQSYRRQWMQQFLTRQPRIFDASMIDSLRQGTAFFASATMIAIGGGIAVVGNPDAMIGLAQDLTLDAEPAGIQFRILLMVAFLSNALLKFIWSHRLFGYCSILMAAVPNDPEDPVAPHRAQQAAEINITAAKSFNRGLRSIYFALGSLAWLLGPVALILAATMTAAVLVRREFASSSRQIMLRDA